MNRDDALLCLERHGTSKIQCADDLQQIRTLGFRGEALPSIASVSRFILTTRERDGEGMGATQVVVHGGRIISVLEAGAPPGTSIEVRQLFFNLPARRKFLRSEETERAHIQHYLALVALAYPQLALTFIQDRRVVWQLPSIACPIPARKTGPVRERLRVVHGSDDALIDVNFTGLLSEHGGPGLPHETQGEGLTVWGLLGAPGVSRPTREHQHLFVNHRPVENRSLNYALLEGYHTALMKGRFPVCCLFLELNPAEVDVNIHPAKREVRFHQDRAVRRLVTLAIHESLLRYHSESRIQYSTETTIHSRASTSIGITFPEVQEHQPGVKTMPKCSPPIEPRNQDLFHPSVHLPPSEQAVDAIGPPLSSKQSLNKSTTAPDLVGLPPDVDTSIPGVSVHPNDNSLPRLTVPMRILGVIGRLYVVLESDRGLVLLDQHAAHERVLYERMIRELEAGPVPGQRLLLAETIELPPRDAQFVRDNLSALTRMGLGLSEFGDRTFLLDSIPPFVNVNRPQDFILDVIAELKAAGEDVNTFRLGEHMVAKTVCRHAVKAHDPLKMEELEKLMDQLRGCAMPYTCPHGRPTLIEFSFKELEKKFGRVQPGWQVI
jgi:DNA mismatch repair protein MutL